MYNGQFYKRSMFTINKRLFDLIDIMFYLFHFYWLLRLCRIFSRYILFIIS